MKTISPVMRLPDDMTASRTQALLPWAALMACLLTGAMQELMPLSDEVYWLNLLSLSGVTVYTLLRVIFTPITVTLWDFFASMVGMMYGLGTLNSEVSAIKSFHDLTLLTSAPPLYIHETMGYVSVLVALLLLGGRFSKAKLLGGITPEALNAHGILIFSTLTASACVVLVALGTIGYHGDVLAEDSITPSFAATYAIFCAGPAAAALVFMWRQYTGVARIVAVLVLLALFAVNLYQGRRNVTYAIIVCAVAHFAATRSKTLISRQSIAAIVLAICVMPVITTGFMAMRLASYEMPLGKKPSVGQLMGKALEIIQRDKSEVDRQSQDNLKDRTFLVGYLSELAWRTDIRQPMYGELFLYDVAMSIPQVLWPGKFKYVRTGSEEALSHPLLGMQPWDAANSVLTTGMTDFGPVGMVLYPLGIIFGYVTILRAIKRLDVHIFCIMSFAFLICLANIEGQMLGYFAFLRDVILVCAVLYVAILLSNFVGRYNRPLIFKEGGMHANRSGSGLYE